MIFTFEKLEDNNEQQHTFVATDDDTNTNYEIKFTLVSFHFLYNILFFKCILVESIYSK